MKTTKLALADLDAHERERIAVSFHEAGHAMACTVLGGRISMAVVGPDRDGSLGETHHAHVPAGALPQIFYAGPWVQAHWEAGRRPSQADLFRVLDGHGCRDYRSLQADGGMAAASGIVPLLQRCWPSIVTLAGQLYYPRKARLVRNNDVLAALGITDGGGPGSRELAMIRSGCAPGSFRVTAAATG